MNPRLALVLAIVPLSSARADGGPKTPILIEWADHARDSKALAGNPTLINSLFCARGECRLTTISVGTTLGSCPLLVGAQTWETRDRDLVVRWGREGTSRTVEIRVTTIVGNIARRLVLRDLGNGVLIVEAASGVATALRPIGGGPATAAEIVAYVKGTPGFDPREWAKLELPCREISVIAAKRQP